MIGSRVRAEDPGPQGWPSRIRRARAVDRPAFWWSIGAVFLVNAGLSAADGQWAVAILQLLTCMWAVVAGVTAQHASPTTPK